VCMCELCHMNYETVLKNDKMFLSLTSLHVSEFEHLLLFFEPICEDYYKWNTIDGKKRKLPRLKANAKERLPSGGQKLFFLMVYLKNNRCGEPSNSAISSRLIWHKSRSGKPFI
jgi:hypothetical protein